MLRIFSAFQVNKVIFWVALKLFILLVPFKKPLECKFSVTGWAISPKDYNI
jgi:hypothetical protein